MKKNVFFSLAIAAALVSCNSGSGDSDQSADSGQHDTEHFSENENALETVQIEKSNQISNLLDSYFVTKDALKDDNAEGAKEGIAQFVVNLDEAKADNVPADLLTSLESNSEAIQQGDIAVQREHFEKLSHDMKELVLLVGADRDVYQQYCPMYKNDEGGMWLSQHEDLLNTLFGSQMLKCGFNQEKLAVQ